MNTQKFYAKLDAGQALQAYPEAEASNRFKPGSFLSRLPAGELAALGVVEVVVPAYPVDGYRYLLGAPYQADGVWKADWVQQDTPERERAMARLSQQVRQDRNHLLAACDWTQTLDAQVDRAAWASYRQALRDITSQPGFPFSVVWPTPPN